MTDIEKIKWAIERNQSEFVRICEHCFENDCNNCHEKNYHILINDALKEMMNNNTAIDAKPIIHGHWVYNVKTNSFDCTNCNESMVRNVFNYCPWCGAKMDEVSE